MRLFWLPAALIVLASPLKAAEVIVTPVVTSSVTSSGQPIVLPQKNVEVVVSTYSIPPGAKLPVHKHAYPRYGYVLSGTLNIVNMDTGKNEVFKAGDFIFESIGQWHKADNSGSEPVKLLVIDQIDKTAENPSNTVIRQP
jgi:quercetin dioxygenase-like cupin family protein